MADRVVILEKGCVLIDEELDRLKERIKRLHITSGDVTAFQLFNLPRAFALNETEPPHWPP